MRESKGLSIFRILILSGIFFLLCMLYWSSLLVEEDLKNVKGSIEQLKSTIVNQSRIVQQTTNPQSTTAPIVRQYMDASLPNILQDDPFYSKTLAASLLSPHFFPHGTLREATIGKPDNLHPLSNWYDVSKWRSLCGLSLAKSTFGYFEKYSPSAAIKIEERLSANKKQFEYWIHLREGMEWQPLEQGWFSNTIQLAPHFLKKHPVTAHDFKFFIDTILNPFVTSSTAVGLKQSYEDLEEIEVLDDLTLVLRWKTYPYEMPDGSIQMRPLYLAKESTIGLSALPSFVYKYFPNGTKLIEEQDSNAYRNNSTFAQLFMEHWAKNIIPSCGSMVFDGMDDERIAFKRNPDYFEPLECLVERRQTDFKQTEDGVWQAFKQGDLSFITLQPKHLLDFEQFQKTQSYRNQSLRGAGVHTLSYLFRAYTYLGWNETKELFKSKKVRKALTMAIDRQRIINQILQGQGIEISQPFYPYSSSYDQSLKPLPFDPVQAKRLLEEEGFYDSEGDGILAKKTINGLLRFEFSLTYYVKNPTTKAICEYISTTLKEIGVKCILHGVDVADMSNLFDDKNFDVYYLAWVLSNPPENLKFLWHSSLAKQKGSPNAIGFENKEVDKIIDQLELEYDPKKRQELYHRFDSIIYDETPYTLIYASKPTMVYRDNVQNVFIPLDRQDLIPGAVVAEPDSTIFWIKEPSKPL